MENKEVSSVDNFGLEVEMPDKSLIQIRKNPSDSSIDPLGPPGLTVTHGEYVPFKITLCFLW